MIVCLEILSFSAIYFLFRVIIDSSSFPGHGPAVHNVGVHYFAGRGVDLDMKKAAEYFTEAAEAGFELSLVSRKTDSYSTLQMLSAGLFSNLLTTNAWFGRGS